MDGMSSDRLSEDDDVPKSADRNHIPDAIKIVSPLTGGKKGRIHQTMTRLEDTKSVMTMTDGGG